MLKSASTRHEASRASADDGKRASSAIEVALKADRPQAVRVCVWGGMVGELRAVDEDDGKRVRSAIEIASHGH